MISKQDIVVLLAYFLGYSTARNTVFRLRRKPVTRFLTFHDITPGNTRCFEEKLLFLSRKTNVLNIDDFFLGRLSLSKINVVLTFDDGYKGWVTNGIPILKRLKLPAIFFVSSGFVGLSKESESEFVRSKLFVKLPFREITGGLNSDELRMIVDEGFAIGGHTLNHSILSEIEDKNELKNEIYGDKVKLEKIIGKQINYFSYPSGAYQNSKVDLVEVLKKSGYRGAVTILSGPNDFGSNPFLLCRELTNADMPLKVFKARVLGNMDAIQTMKKVQKMFLKLS